MENKDKTYKRAVKETIKSMVKEDLAKGLEAVRKGRKRKLRAINDPISFEQKEQTNEL